MSLPLQNDIKSINLGGIIKELLLKRDCLLQCMLLHAIESPRSGTKSRFDLNDSAELGDFPNFLDIVVTNGA